MFFAYVRNIGGIKRTSMKQFLVTCDLPGVAQQFPQPQWTPDLRHCQQEHKGLDQSF